jgi:hypothetical protein
MANAAATLGRATASIVEFSGTRIAPLATPSIVGVSSERVPDASG